MMKQDRFFSRSRLSLSALTLSAFAALPTAASAQNAGDQIAVPAHNSATGAAGGLFANSTFEIATGVDYSVGKYGALVDTSVISIPLDLKAQIGRLRLQAALPYQFLKGPGQLVGGVVVTAPGDTSTVKREGLGDLNLSAAYLLNNENGVLPAFEIGGGAKLPTAKATLGTGETDYSVTASAYKSLSSTVMLFGSVGYSWLGSPAAYQLKNGIVASGGFNFRPKESQNYGVSIAYREPVAAGLQGQAVVSPYMTVRASKLLGLTLYGMAGFNDASPRWGAGIRLSLFP